MKARLTGALLLGLVLFPLAALSHDLPVSYIDLRVTETGVETTIESSAKNFARELTGVEEETLLLDPEKEREKLAALIVSRLELHRDNEVLHPELRAIQALAARRDLRMRLFFPMTQIPETLRVRCDLFQFDPRHKTFVNIYGVEALKYQDIYKKDTGARDYSLRSHQEIGSVVRQFIREGVHHIFIGPDHILFVIGLLLLGGTLARLLKIVTAFTIAHSVTLVLATLNIVNPPARVIEPAIALSIVFVGSHALLQRGGLRDWRLLFAFGFGFIHGFGFANVLREMQLPREALGWSLFSFNLGVEIGQACIVLAAAPLLGLLIRRNTTATRALITAGSFGVVAAGAFWFTQRLFPAA